MRIAIIGCGLIGRKRAEALPNGALQVACDIDAARALAIAGPRGAATETDWHVAVTQDDIDAVIVATTHDLLATVATEAARHGKHVLIEKPGARRAHELDELATIASERGLAIRVGFNHRYHRALQQARKLVDEGAIGIPQLARARYGHGGRPGYDREWRAVPEVSGGGEAIDQGMHLVDLAGWFLGDFSQVQGEIATFFWDMPVEDNVFFLLRTGGGAIAQLHASWTEWKNLFSFELSGRGGKLEVTGLGGSYGTERLAYYKMLPEMGPPDTTIWEYPMADDSWQRETSEWLDDMLTGRPSRPSIAEAQTALRVVERVYHGSRI